MPDEISRIKSSSGSVDASVTDQLSSSMLSKFKSIEDVMAVHVDVDIESTDYYLIPVNIPVGTKFAVFMKNVESNTTFNLTYVQEGGYPQILVQINPSTDEDPYPTYTYTTTVAHAAVTYFGFYATSGLKMGIDIVYPFEHPYWVLNDAVNSGKLALTTAMSIEGLKEVPIDFSDTIYAANRIDNNGDMVLDKKSRCTGLLSTEGVELLEVVTHINGEYALVMFYDEDYKLVSQVEGGAFTNTVSHYLAVPSNAKYFQYYAYVGDNQDENDFRIKLYFPSRESEFAVYAGNRVYHGHRTGYVGTPNVDTPYIIPVTTITSAEHTDMIPLIDAVSMRVSNLYMPEATYAVMFFDADFSFMENISIMGSGAADYYIRLTGDEYANAKYVMVNSYYAHGFMRGDLTVTMLSAGGAEKDYTGKRILFIGDSITALGDNVRGWPRYFKEYVECSESVNVAVPGATWCDRQPDTVYDGTPEDHASTGTDLNVIGNQVEKISRGKDTSNPNYSKVEEYQEFDAVFIAAGTNDVMPSGNVSDQFFDGTTPVSVDSVDRTKWAGAVRYAYEKLRGMYPDAKIFICSPIQGAEDVRSYSQITTKRNYLREVCDRISDVIFVDTFLCGISGVYEVRNVVGRDLNDGLHPNANGAKKMARYNANKMAMAYAG